MLISAKILCTPAGPHMYTGWPSYEGHMRASRCTTKSELFNGILMNLEHGLHVCWFRLNFWRGSLVNMSAERQAHPPVRISLCVRIFFDISARQSTQNGWGTVRPVYCGELFTHLDTGAKSSSPYCMVAVLIVSEYICKQFSTVWISALIPNYLPSRWRIELMCIHCERNGKTKRFRWPK